MIIGGYLPQVRHLIYKGPMCSKPKFQLINLVERIQKLCRILLFLMSIKGIKCDKAIKNSVESGSQRTEGK